MNLLSEVLKVDTALTPSNLAGAGTGSYFRMDRDRKALFVVEVGAMAAAATAILQVMQATTALAGGAKVVTNNAATITANAHVAAAILTLANVQNGDVVVINGLTFTAAGAADLPNRVFSVAGADDADAASLVLAINHATAGVPGVLATSAAAVVTLVASEPGDIDITITLPAGTITPATLRAVGYVECDSAFLDDAVGYDHVALRVTTSAAMQTGAVLLRGNGRYTPTQYVAAAKTDVV